MKILIDNVLKQRGKTRNWLSDETGITYANIKNLCDSKTSSLKFQYIDMICSVLNCEISDILSPDYIEINRYIAAQRKLDRYYNKKDGT